MNIFETIEGAASKTEPFHSRFLADALEESSKGDRSLFEAVWTLVAPSEWEAPERPEILREVYLCTGSIDIVIRTGDQCSRIVGIEVKTNEGSTTEGQLERYRVGLAAKYPKADIAITYLTPFNKERAAQEGGVEAAESLPTVREFKEFSEAFPRARHVSWLDVADICWGDNVLWEQHRGYVRKHISTSSLLKVQRNRELDHFFGQGPTRRFREGLASLQIKVGSPGEDINIDLKLFSDEFPSFTEGLVKVLDTLIREGEGVSRKLRTPREDAFNNRHEYLESSLSAVHVALFRLADRYHCVWLEGKKDYGVRIAHHDYRSGVSLIRSVGHGGL